MTAARLDQLWDLFQTYRDRYASTGGLEELESLERSIRRRELRAHALRRRQSELTTQLANAERELAAVETEISGARATGALLIEDMIDRVKLEHNEGWSPAPILGYRVWRIEDNAVLGNQMPWRTETMEAKCLQEVPGQDVPHSIERCGPPPCGIYAVKDLNRFAPALANGSVPRSVVGVVAMTGKIIEHDLGFRARRATAVAALVNLEARRSLMTRPNEISHLFRDPAKAVATSGRAVRPAEGRKQLEAIYRKEEQWT